MKRILGISHQRPPAPGIAETIDTVDKKAENVNGKVNQCDQELRKLQAQMRDMKEGGAKNVLKEKARRILMRRKQYEAMSDSLHQQSFNMEQATATMESAKTNQQIFSAMKVGAKELKKIYKNLKVDDIEDLQDQMEQIYDTSEELQSSLGRNYNVPDIDEDELVAELEALGHEIAADNDASYLDQATQVPIPNNAGTLPVQEAATSLPKAVIGGVKVDEYGLPIVETEVHTAK